MREAEFRIGYYFQLSFVPGGYRNARTEWFKTESLALIRTIDAAEARSAFKVTFPPSLPRNPKFRELNPDYRVPLVELELLQYDGGVWWPFWTWHADFGLGGEFSLDQLRCLLEEDHDICNFLPSPGPVRYDSGGIAAARKIIRDDRDRNLSIANRILKQNLLICDGRPYVRGGVPLYFNDWIKDERSFRLTVGDAGADRAPLPPIGTSFTYQHVWRRPTLRRGDIWLATDRATALTEACGNDDETPTIQVLAPDLVQDIRARLALDAIYHATCEIFEKPPNVPRFVRRQAPAFLNRLMPARDATDDAATSNRRYNVLADMLHENIQYPPFKRLAKEFASIRDRHCLEIPLFRTAFLGPKEELAMEDEDALARIANGM